MTMGIGLGNVIPPEMRTRLVRLRTQPQAGGVQLTAIAPTLELGEDEQGSSTREITGTITVYDTASTSQGIVIHEGALTARQPLTRVKLLRDHDHGDPVGYMTALSEDALTATFYVPEGENGDRALQEAKDHLRDGLSVGFSVKQYTFDDEYNLHVYEAELYEVSLCAIPDMADAGVTDVAAAATRTERGQLMNLEQLRAALAAGTITQAVFDREALKLAMGAPQPDPAPHVDPALAAGPVPLEPTPAPAIARQRGLSLNEAINRVTVAFQSGDRLAIQLAIQDVVPGDDVGQGFIGREDWLGEVWRASNFERTWINAWGPTQPLNALKMKGWYWDVRPKVAKYAGDKAEVASNKPKTKPLTGDAERWAGGWDIDRAYIDFGDGDYLAAFWNAAVDQYQLESDGDIAAKTIAAATALAPMAANVTGADAIKTVIRAGRAVRGGKINRVFLAEDLYDDFLDTPADNLPLWLSKASVGVGPAEGTAEVDQLHIVADSSLDDGQVVGFDNRAGSVRERTPIQLKAFDVAHAGVDLGFYSYGGLLVTDPRLVLKATAA